MSGKEPDFDIDNYGIDELLDIFGIESPLKKEAIMKIAAGFIEKYQKLKQTAYVEFFSKAMNKLVSNYNLVEGILGKVDGIIDDVIENKDLLEDKAEELFEDAENLYEQGSEFIADAKEKIDEFLNPEVEDAGPNVLKNRYYNGQTAPERVGEQVMPNRGNYISVPEEGVSGHAPQLQQRLMLPNAFAQIPFAQGYRNPTLQNVFISWINIDSQYREIKPTGIESVQCNGLLTTSSNKYEQHDNSTDFLFTLQQPITNVMAMTVGSIEVPLAGYYTFSNKYGNTTFELIVEGKEPICLRIPEGNYTSTALMEVVNQELKSAYAPLGGTCPIMVIDESNQKTYFAFYPTNPTPSEKVKLRWYNRDRCGCCANCCDINLNLQESKAESEEAGSSTKIIADPSGVFNQCLKKNTGKKINSTFGWTMGFRVEESEFQTINTRLNIVADASLNEINGADTNYYGTFSQTTWNELGTKYMILEIDDFNRNRNSGNMGTMTMPRSSETFKIPQYAKELSEIYPLCKDPSGVYQHFDSSSNLVTTNKKIHPESFKRAYRKGTPALQNAIKGQDTLTEAQKYTAKELLAAKRKTPIHQYYSPQSSDILFRFPVQRLSTNIQAPLIIPNSAGMDNGRRYFGPVTIEKLRVKLLDDKGYPIDLHGGDISFSLILERLYQY